MKAKEIMSKEVVTILSGSIVADVVKLMVDHKVGCVLIVKDSEAIGVVTERDILEKVVSPKKDQMLLEVDDIMSSPLVTISPDADMQEIVEKLTKNKIKKLPVVDGEHLVGIVTTGDIVAKSPDYIAELASLVLRPTKIIGG